MNHDRNLCVGDMLTFKKMTAIITNVSGTPSEGVTAAVFGHYSNRDSVSIHAGLALGESRWTDIGWVVISLGMCDQNE